MTTALTDEDHAELQAYRHGRGQLAADPMHAGQPVHECSNVWDDAKYYLQVTHQGMPLWSCACCSKLTIGPPGWGAPEKCAGCEHGTADDLGPALYESPAACRLWPTNHGGQYDGPCLIAGSDGCECPEATR